MEPDIKDFTELEKFIKENPKGADELAFEWQQFLKINASESPELSSIQTSEELNEWSREHPEKNIDPSVWKGWEISQAYYYLREQHEDSQMREGGEINSSSIPQGLMETPLLASAFLQKTKTMEDDRAYQDIEKKLQQEWLKKNNAKDFSSNEGMEYLYGSLDNNTKAQIRKDAEGAFRNNPKFKKKVERYDKERKKVYKDHEYDPTWQAHEHNTQVEMSARLELLEKSRDKKIKTSKEEIKKSQDEIIQKVSKKSQEEFAEKNPEKAKAYLERMGAKRKKNETEETSTSGSSTPDAQNNQVFMQNPQAIITQTREEGPQEDQPSSTSTSNLPGRGTNRGVNAINRLARKAFSNPLKKIGKRVAAQAAQRTLMSLLLSTAQFWAPIVITLLLISTVVFVIVASGGAPTAPSLSVDSEIITPTPAELE